MDKRTEAKFSENLGALFGWIWIFSWIAIPVLILWTIYGEGRWYYCIMAFVIGQFCKSLCRGYKKQAESIYYESTGVDYAKQWVDLPVEEKRNEVKTALKDFVSKYHPHSDVNSVVTEWDYTGMVDQIVEKITEGYSETKIQKPYNVICHSFVNNMFTAQSS